MPILGGELLDDSSSYLWWRPLRHGASSSARFVDLSANNPFTMPGVAHRVAGWRAGQVTIKEPDHGSTPPPLIPDVGNYPVRLEKQVLSDRLPSPSWPEPRSATSLRPPTVTRFCGHGTPASECWACLPSSPLLPGALCSGGVLLPPSLLLRPHVPVSCPPAHFPFHGYSVGLTDARPSPLWPPTLQRSPPPVRRKAGCVHAPNSFRNRTSHRPIGRGLAPSFTTVALSTPSTGALSGRW